MMRSVSMFAMSSGAATALRVVKVREEPAHVGDPAGDRGGGGHGRAHQVGARAFSLAAFEIAIGGRRAAQAGIDEVAVHADAHGAARREPLQARLQEDPVQSFGFCGLLHQARAGHHHRRDHRLAPLDHGGGNAQVFKPAVGAGADEDAVHGKAL